LLPLLNLVEGPLPAWGSLTTLLISAIGGNAGAIEFRLNGGVVTGVSTLNAIPWSIVVPKLLRMLAVLEAAVALPECPFTEPGVGLGPAESFTVPA
jgi:hypothetical protein